ncbi:ERF family protein [Clostridium sp. MSJ-11]|uniref:ERF family protein n=1 Tax=Clostridium mobile TaxID=2841512 RepID=A0ABS6EMT2_9CLOT|nr:ERF family protein [Clostridium mobile]MBU5486432.1 ERF family protein [Clostridium mobile]
MNIYQKLMDIQNKLKAPKNQFNDFGKYKYRSCEDILEGVKPMLKEVNAILVLNDNVEQIGDRIYIKAIATLIDTEKGEKIEVSAYAREDETKKGMDLSQITGSTSSYARKYALNGLFCIDDTKDSDATNTHSEKEGSKGNVITISDGQQKRLFAIAKGNTELVKKILLEKGYTKSADIPKGKAYEEICKEIESKVS